MDVFEAIQESAHLFLNPNDSLGYGIPNFYQAYQNYLNLSTNALNLSIYPNPFQETFSIYNSHSVEYVFDIFNIFGVSIFSKRTHEANLIINALSNSPTGIYFLKIRGSSYAHPILKLNEQ